MDRLRKQSYLKRKEKIKKREARDNELTFVFKRNEDDKSYRLNIIISLRNFFNINEWNYFDDNYVYVLFITFN